MKSPNRPSYTFWSGITVPSGAWTDGNKDGIADPGETIVYSLHITNAGTVSLYDLVVASDAIGAENIENFMLSDSGLAPKATITLSVTYKVHTYMGSKSIYWSESATC